MSETDTRDHFSLEDRKELIRQGILIDQFKEDLIDIKLLVNDNKMESRIRVLEDERLIIKAQVKASRYWISLIATALSALISLLFKYVIK